MNDELHAASDRETDDTPSLTLVLPPHLAKDAIVEGLVQVIERLRDIQALRAGRFRQMAEECAASRGREFRLGLWRGQARAAAEAAAAIDESIVEVFDLWSQYEAQTLPGPSEASPGQAVLRGTGQGGQPVPGPAGPSEVRSQLIYHPAAPASVVTPREGEGSP